MKNNSVVKTSLVTFLTLLIITTLIISSFLLFFPKATAEFCYNLGWYDLSAKYYLNDYNKSKDINLIAKACDINIYLSSYENYITAFELFENDAYYYNYINNKNQINYSNSQLNILTKSALVNENNYYKNYYVKALVKTNKIDHAKSYIIQNAKSISNVDYKVPFEYLYTNLLEINEYIWFINTQITNNYTLYELIIDNYKICADYYETIKNNINIDKIYFINFSRSIITMGNNIILIANNTQQTSIASSDVSLIANNISNINKKISELL